MIDITPFQPSREELDKRLRWYSNKFGPYIEKRGLNNWKNLFRKPTSQEWIILVMLMMGLFIGWAYNNDTSECRTFLEDLGNNACKICNIQLQDISEPNPLQLPSEGLEKFKINEENPDTGENKGE